MAASSPQNASFGLALLLNRLTLGAYFFSAGTHKVFSMGVQAFYEQGFKPMQPGWLPEWFAQPYGHAVPFAEIAVGALLILGLFGRVTASVAFLLLLSFTMALVIHSGSTTAGGPVPYVHSNFILITLALLLAITGAGPLSADGALRGKGRSA